MIYDQSLPWKSPHICSSVHPQTAKCTVASLSPTEKPCCHFTETVHQRSDWPAKMKVQQRNEKWNTGSHIWMQRKWSWRRNCWLWQSWNQWSVGPSVQPGAWQKPAYWHQWGSGCDEKDDGVPEEVTPEKYFTLKKPGHILWHWMYRG